jgi:hypothetical protein
MKPTLPFRRAVLPTLAAALFLAACAAAFDEPVAHAAGGPSTRDLWPPAWQDGPQGSAIDFTPPAFDAPSATHCQRLPGTREVPGGGREQRASGRLSEGESLREPVMSKRRDARDEAADAVESRAAAKSAPAGAAAEYSLSLAPPPWPSQPAPAPRPARETVTAGMVDDNADFGEYLNYRQRQAGLAVRERDIGERYLLEVTDTNGRPVHDAEVAVQRPGVAQPVMWARTDTAGRVWLHPRAFLAPAVAEERTLGVAVRAHGVQGRALLQRGQAASVQVRLGAQPAVSTRLDLVFMVDATGSMGDEIAKLKQSMRAMADQIAQLPGQPDICYGLVAYRDRGDAFITRTHDFTNDLGAFQQVLAKVQANGGGDTPEAMNEALHEVVHGLSWRQQAARMVVMVADAPPHLDYGGCMSAPEGHGISPPWAPRAAGSGQPVACPQYDRDMQAALSKGIKLFAVGASGLDPVGEYVFRQMAQYTAGRFVFLTYRDAANPGSGPGTQTVHDVKQYSVQTLDKLVVRLVGEELSRLKKG